MNSASLQAKVVRFGPFEFEVRSGILRKAGKPLQLQPQPAKILALLVTRCGDVVTREELQREIWGDDTFVDFEHNLNFSVRQIRAVLRDNPKKPRFIETLPRRGYRFISNVSESSVQTIQSLAVLPLENLSNDPEQDYFADGMTDELITELAKISNLRVISRTSVQCYKKARKPLPQIARKLNVDAVVEGTVLRSGDRVRITAQLIDARREAHLWAQGYERNIDDVLQLQAELAQAIALQIHVKLSSDEQSRLQPARQVNPAAYECYLRGRYFWNRRTEETLVRAHDYFSQAIGHDAGYALAHAGLADTYFYRGYVFGRLEPREAMPHAKAAVSRALELDPSLGEAHISLALVQFLFDWDWKAARSSFEKGLRLSPNYATGYHAYSAFLACTGHLEQSIHEAQRALTLDPLSIPIHNILGEMYMFNRDWERAIAQFQNTIEMDSNVWIPHENLGIVYEQLGDHETSVDQYLIARGCAGAKAESLAELRNAYAESGLSGFLQRQVEFDLSNWDGWHVGAFRIASLYARLGQADLAIEWIRRIFDARSGCMVWTKLYPWFTSLQDHPAFREMTRQVGLPE
jgi:TolB-like protein/Tfp pilus assembly protein PilF